MRERSCNIIVSWAMIEDKLYVRESRWWEMVSVCIQVSYILIMPNNFRIFYAVFWILKSVHSSLFSLFFESFVSLFPSDTFRTYSALPCLALQCECCMLFRHSHAPLWSTDTRISLQPNNWQVSLSLSFKHTELSRRKILIVISFVWIECGRECVVGWLVWVCACESVYFITMMNVYVQAQTFTVSVIV